MGAPLTADSLLNTVADMMARIRALEARRPQSGCCWGESVEVEGPGQIVTGTEVLEFDEVYDPHGIFDGTDTFTIPAGMAGVWAFSQTWRLGGE